MKKLYLFVSLFTVTLFYPLFGFSQSVADSVKVAVVKINSNADKTDSNYAGKTTAGISTLTEVVAKVSINDFNLSSSEIGKAELRLFFKAPNTMGVINFFEMDASWDIATVTWNIAESLYNAETSFVSIDVDQEEDAFYYIDITSYIKEKIDAGSDFAFRMKSDGTADATIRTSDHATAIYQPTILLYGEATNVQNIQTEKSLTVYPNPASSVLTVQLAKNVKSTLSLHNNTGSRVFTGEYSSDKIKLDISQMSPGIYFLKVESQSSIIGIEKIVVK